ILVEQTAEEVSPGHVGGHRGGSGRQRMRSRRWDQSEPSMWSVVVVMADVDSEHPFEGTPIHDEEPVETLRPHRPNPALRVGVGPGGPHWRAENPNLLAPEHLIKRPGELAIPIPYQEPHRALDGRRLPSEIPRLLGDPGGVRVRRAAPKVHLPTP